MSRRHWLAGAVASMEVLDLISVLAALRIRGAILMDKLPLPVNQRGLEIIIWIRALIPGCSVSDFQVDNGFSGFIE